MAAAQITPVQNEYLYGKGKIAVCERDGNGGVSESMYLGNCPELKISSSSEKITHFESESGRNVQDREITKTVSIEFSITFENISRRNLALMWWGEVVTEEQEAAKSHDFPEGITVGEIHVVPGGYNMSNVVIKDSVDATLSDTKYNLDADFGVVEFLDISGYTQPFTIEWDQGASEAVPLFTTERPARFIRFEGINLGNPGEENDKVLVELYNGTFDPPTDFSLIGDDFAKFELKGSLQVDEGRKASAELGGYGHIVKMGAAYVAESSSSSSSS